VFLQLTVPTGATELFVPNTWCEDELLAAAAAACIVLSKKKKQRRKHKVWVRQSLQERYEYGVLRLTNSLSKDQQLSGHIIDGHTQNFIRISSSDLE
jgi:riboflavin synthase alpha subunit